MIVTAPTAPELIAPEQIRIRGARVHNLQNIDLDIPRDALVVITGPSGSGKSSLAIDTLCAEGQRQYVESLSTYARQFLHQMQRPDVDHIEGLQPTIAIDQRVGSPNPRSTVATVTEIYDFLRLLYARLGQASCPACGAPIRQQTLEEIMAAVRRLPEGTKGLVLAPLVRGRKGAHKDVLAEVRKAGFVRVRIDGQLFDIEKAPELEPRKTHQIEAVIDRVVIREGLQARLAESIQLALRQGDETVIFCYNNGEWHDLIYSTRYACPQCQLGYEEIEPRTFSFNSPYGACEACDGLGSRVEFDPDLVFPNRELSLSAGAVSPWKGLSDRAWKKIEAQLAPFFRVHKLALDTPLAQWKPVVWEQFLRRSPSANNARGGKNFPGVLTMLEKEYATTLKLGRQQRLAGYRGEVICPECVGARLNPQARNVRLGGLAIHELTALAASRARAFCARLSFEAGEQPIAEPLMREINNRLEFLSRVGVDYLSLNRPADSLSGGELQRVRLATGIGSGLVGVCYVLDEPSIGLHPRDNGQLIRVLCELRDQGNSVLVVEHDEAMMRASDHLIDMGPGAGLHGGRIVAAGRPAAVQNDPRSITGRYLSGELSIPLPRERRRAAKTRSLVLSGVTANNLRDVEVTFPLGTLTCVTGVSGSGKSSLINETLARALARRLTGMGPKPGPHHSLRGASQLDKLVEIDQLPIGRTPRSNPATYTGVFDEIRKVFAGTREARQRGFGPGRFSFNVKRGRCEVCQGQGQQRIDMNFLPDLYVTCPECGGKRFNRQTLEVPYKGLSIAEVLDLRIDEALTFFENFPVIARLLSSLTEVGMGYVTLGQSSITLSGGEAQRIKLATELARVETGNTLYILDEPTTGLHFDDVRKLLEVLQRLVDRGNTVLVIEHNLDVIKSADWLIDLGPEGGEAGGQVIVVGTPEEVAECVESHTGRFLRPLLER